MPPFPSWARDKETQLERALAVLGLSRALLLLPPDQSAFAPSTAAFTRHIPESVWGLLALALSLWLWCAANRPKNYANRRNAARATIAHSLVLFPLYALSNPWATVGWYHLLFALCATVLTFARSSDIESQKHAALPPLSRTPHQPNSSVTPCLCGEPFFQHPKDSHLPPPAPLDSGLRPLASNTCPTP